MAISEAQLPVSVSGDGITTTFSPGIYALDASHVTVTHVALDETETLLVEGVDYSLAWAGEKDEVHFTLTYPLSGSPLPPSELLVISRNTPVGIFFDLEKYQGISSEALELAFFKIALVLAESDQNATTNLIAAVNSAQAAAVICADAKVICEGFSDVEATKETLGLVVGEDVQPFNDQLADIAGLTPSAGDVLYFDGTNFVNLRVGAAGQVLTAGASAPEWVDAPNGAWEYLSDKTVTIYVNRAEVEITGLGGYRDIAVYTDSDTTVSATRAVKVGVAAGYPTGIYIPEAGGPTDEISLHQDNSTTNRAGWAEVLNFNTNNPLKRVSSQRTSSSKIVMIDSILSFDRVKFVVSSGLFAAGGTFHVWGRS